MEALCVVRCKLDSGRQLSDDAGVEHELIEHVAVFHDIRIKQIPLCCCGGTTPDAASSPRQTEQPSK